MKNSSTSFSASSRISVACNVCGHNSAKFFCSKEGFNYVRCFSCRHVYVKDRVPEEQILHIYATRVSHHSDPIKEQWDFSDVKHRYFYQPILKTISDLIPPGRLLDIGCSTGAFLNAAQKEGWAPEGLELELPSIEIAQKHHLTVHQATLHEKNFLKDSFSAITMWGVLEHLSDPKAIVQEIYRILKPGGVFAFSTPNISCLGWKFLKTDWGCIAPVAHLNLFNIKGCQAILKDTGYHIHRLETLEIQPSTLKQIMAKVKRIPLKEEANAVAKLAHKSTTKMTTLMRLRRFTNLPIKLLGWGEDIYGYAQKPES